MTTETKIVESPATPPPAEAATPSPADSAPQDEPSRVTDLKQIVPLQLVLSTVSAATLILSPLYFIGLWKLEYEFATVYKMDFWTAWSAANLEPRYVVAINGLLLLDSASVGAFIAVLLLTAGVVYGRRYRFAMQDGQSGLSLSARALRSAPSLRRHHSVLPLLLILFVVVIAAADSLVNRPINRDPGLLALNAVAVLAVLTVYYLFLVSAVDLHTRRDLSLAGSAGYFLAMSFIYHLTGTQHPMFWTVIIGALGTLIGARVVASLMQRRVFFDLGPLALLFAAYVCALLPAYFWVNRGQWDESLNNLATPFVQVCLDTTVQPDHIYGNLISEDRGSVHIIPIRAVYLNGSNRARARPGNYIMYISSRQVTRIFYPAGPKGSCKANPNLLPGSLPVG
jgi:hypothetical protein